MLPTRKGSLFASFLLLLLTATLTFGQTETGQLTGTVTDPTGAVVANAKVTAKNAGTSATRATTTNEQGLYGFANLLPGVYQVTVEATGFSVAQLQAVVSVGSRVGVDIRLEVGRTDTVVQVSEQAGQINTETQTVGTVVTTKQVLELPTLTRNPYSLVAISGNVSPDDPSGRGTGYAINGLRSAGTNALLDGAANNDEFTASVGQQVPLDSIQEFSILTNNFTAEFGRAAAGVVNVATRSGSNDLHGTAYWFNRLSRLSSNDFDNNANGITRPIFTRNQPGYSVGGPVKKDKLFFFQSTEWIRTRSAGIRNVWIPTPELIARTAPSARGFFQSLGNRRTGLQTLETLNRTQLAARGANICAGQAATGLCNSLPADLPVFSRVSYSRPADSGGGTPTNTHFGVARLDYNLSEKTQIYGRLAWESISNLVGSNADSPYAGFDSGSDQRNYNLLVSAIRTFSPTLISQSKAVVNRLKNIQPLGDQPPTPTLYLASGSTATRLLGNLVAMPGYLPFNPGSAIPFGGPQNFAQLYEDLSWSKGAHQIRMGATFTYQQDNRTFGAFQNPVQQVGNNFGRGMENLLAGQLFQFQAAIDPQGKFPCNGPVTPQCSVNLPVGFPNFSRSNRYKEFGLYIQDAWKISRNVSLNLGVRYEYFGVQKNKNPRLDSNFYPAQGQTEFLQLRNGDVAIAPNSYVGGLWKPDWNNFGPRLGFAWDVFGNGNTSLRGGYGLSYERNFGNVTFNVIQNPPNYAVISVQPVDVGGVINITTALAGPLAGNVGTKGVPPTSLRAVNPEIRTAYAQFWSLSLEHQIVRNVLFAIDYSGSKGSKLYSLENPNRVGAGNVLLGDACTTGSGPGAPGNCTARLLRNTGYTNINMRNGKGFSNYNSMNARFTVRNVGNSGVNLISNYTWGHAIDNLSDTFSSSGNQYNLGLLDPFNPRLDKGDAYFDNRHRWALSGQWEVPFARGLKGVANKILHGWSIAPILTARTGSPFTLYDTTWAGILNAVYPRAFFTGPVAVKPAESAFKATATPNINIYMPLTGLPADSSYVNPITKTSEFGPYPATMSGRNRFRGPGAWNIDGGIYKNTRINERVDTQLRLEMYNSMNHANLFVDSGSVDMSFNEYVPASRSGNRNIQLALKIIF